MLRLEVGMATALFVAAACAGGETEWAGSMTDSAGVMLVTNPEVGVWSEADRWTVVEELRIGSEGDPDYQFGQVGWIAVGGDGGIYVLDAQGQHIKAFSAAGQFARVIGRPGSGPGELGQGAVFLVMAPGDTLLVPDVGNQRLNRYAADGTSLGSVRLSFEDGIPLAWRGTASGLVAGQVRPMGLPNMAARDSMDAIVTRGPDGQVRDTLLRFPSGQTFSFGGGAPQIKLYSPEPIWTITDDGRLYFAVNDDYRIKLYAPGGRLARVIAKPFTREPVTESDRNALMRFIERAWQDAGVPAAMVERLRGMIQFGEFLPAFAALQAGPEETLWVQHVQEASALTQAERESYNPLEDSGGREWDVFGAEGRFLGVVEMPPRFAPRLFVGDRIYGVARDELDVQYVVKLAIRRGAAGVG
jgi:hypothetical protein